MFGRVDPSPIGGFGKLKRKEITEIITSLDANMPVVVMDHPPAKLEQYNEKIDLVLAGHTHKGQIFPGNLITDIVFVVDYVHCKRILPVHTLSLHQAQVQGGCNADRIK